MTADDVATLYTASDRRPSTGDDAGQDRLQVQEVDGDAAAAALRWSRYHGPRANAWNQAAPLFVSPGPGCHGLIVVLYRRVGGAGTWHRWGWTCDRCGQVWRAS